MEGLVIAVERGLSKRDTLMHGGIYVIRKFERSRRAARGDEGGERVRVLCRRERRIADDSELRRTHLPGGPARLSPS